MTINTTTLSEEVFYTRLAKLIGQLEGNKPQPYYDTAVPSPNPTIGIGFNLRVEGIRKKVFAAMGIPETKWAALTAIILDTTITNSATLQGQLNAALGATFEMTDAQITAVYEDKVKSYVDAAKAKNSIDYSDELIALASLHFNGLYGAGLKAALNLPDPHEARAEAWYQIRYDHFDQLHKRRYAEAALFGLYDDPSVSPSKEESLAVYRMFTRHRLETNNSAANMIEYDKEFKNDSTYGIPAANDDLTAAGFGAYVVKTLSDELQPAATVLMNNYIKEEYGIPHTFNPLNIQVASDNALVLIGENTIDRTGFIDDLLIGRDSGHNVLSGEGGNDVLIGGTGNDYLDGGEGNDTMIGGAGVDTYVISGHDRIIDEGCNNIIWNGKLIAGVFKEIKDNPGTYTFVSDDKEYCLAFHSPGQLTLSAEDSITFVNQTSAAGFDDNDFGINLTEENPTDFDRILTGTANRDEMGIIAIGNDSQYWQLTYTSFPNGETTNTPFYQEYLSAEAPRMQINGGLTGDFLFGFIRHDEISGGDGGDIIFGNMGSWNGKPVTMTGEMEGDLLDSGAGNDWLGGSGESDQLIGGAGNDLLSGINGDDILWGDADNDVLAGGSHADSLAGGDGDDILLGDGYISGSLALTLDNLASLGFDLTGPANGYYTGYTTRNFTLHNDAPNGGNDILFGGIGRDWLEGGVGADMLDGGTENDALFGGEGDDFLEGGDGNDWLVGDNRDLTGTGDDIITGGKGDDTYEVNSTSDIVIEEAGEGIDTIRSSVSFALPENVEYITFTGGGDLNATGNALNNLLNGTGGANILSGNAGNDTLNGFAGNDILDGGADLDWMAGGLGNDTYYVDDASDVTTETSTLVTEIDSVVSSVTWTLGANLENLTLSGTAANGTGNGLNNTLVGNGEANILNGGAGIDTMIGGLGNDTYYVNNTNDVTTETSTLVTEIDTVLSSVSRTLGANLENLTLTGTAAINGTGNSLANTLLGNKAANILNGGAGIDTMTGGLGNDTYYVNNTNDVTTETSTLVTEIDTVMSSVSRTLGANLENLTLTGTAANGTGNGLNNTLVGNGEANILKGGAGIDTMAGGLGNDTYYVDDASDVTTETSTLVTEIDSVVSSVTWTLGVNLENLTLTGTAANGTGNGLNNTLVGNGEANILNGGAGIDTMIGGLGNDTYYVDDASDVTTETSTLVTEIDSVVSSVTWTLGANLENLTLTGTAANGIGNGLNNTLVGNGGANILNGGAGGDIINGDAGNDFLFGGVGNDSLRGGNGNDFFVFNSILNAATNRDTIEDFIAVDDTIRLDQTIFTNLSIGTLIASQFSASTTGTAGDSDDYILYNTTSGALLYDVDGIGQGVAVQFATLTIKPQITANDFNIVA